MSFKYSFLRVVIRDFISLFYPDFCLGCSNHLIKGETMICTRCMLLMAQTDYHVRRDNPLHRRLVGRLPVEWALSLFVFTKNGRIQKVLHALKYKNEPEVGVTLGKVYGKRLSETGIHFDLIIPVPLHDGKLRRRGYNQSAKFGEGLAHAMGIPMRENALCRKVMTDTQTKKSKLKRWENVNDVFAVREPQGLNGAHVLLVDDVITTGATIEACGVVLLEQGVSAISVASIAVA
jgi:ComF family protein